MQHEFRRTQKMKGNKIIATMVVLAMLLSTLVVLKQLNVVNNASAQPGVTAWGNATEELVYGVSYAKNTIVINTTDWSAGIHYLYYPTYRCSTGAGRPAIDFNWTAIFLNDQGDQVNIDATEDEDTLDTNNRAITFNRSGMWIFDTDSDHSSFDGYIWVNTSNAYTISSISDFTFGSTNDVSIEVKEGDILVNCKIALIGPDGSTILNSATGADVVTVDSDEFNMAGDYTVRAYGDLDAIDAAYYYLDEADNAAYGPLYGSGAFFTSIYTYDDVGPWDPPEKNATDKTFSVTTAKPKMVLTNTTLYWGYKTTIDINITAPDGTGIIDALDNISLKSPDGTYYKAADLTGFTFAEIGAGNYTIELPQWQSDLPASWNTLTNGTWYIVFGYNQSGDSVEEWNTSIGSMNRLVVKGTLAPVQLKIIDDGSGNPTDKKVNIPLFTDGIGVQPLFITFNITGTSITNAGGRLYYGDDDWEDAGNITVTGDLLWPVNEDSWDFTLDYNPAVGWGLWVLPTTPGGTITISIDWPGDDNGTASQTIDVINGSFVSTNVDAFPIGENISLTVTVKDMDQEALKYADVYLVWQANPDEPYTDDDAFNSTTGDNTVGNGRNGEYTFLINTTQMGTWAPRHLTVAVNDDSSELSGYAAVEMNKQHNMRVNLTPITAYAGDSVEYSITVSLLGGGEPDEDGLSIMIYNETGAEVTDPEIVSGIWPIPDDATVTDHEIILADGTYYLAAFNDTHDSQGYNATLTVSSYTVTSSPSVLAWLIDTATNLTFQITPAVDGTLKLLNMTGTNGTWSEHETFVDIVNGTGTLDEINATTLGNVTFEFEPFGGEYRHAAGLLRVTTATATPNPAAIYLSEGTVVTITVTHPATGTPLEDVRVGLDHGMSLNETILAKLPTDQYTDAAGKVQFSITADASGDIVIYLENETDPDNEFVITATARKPMTISLNPSINEVKTFTAEAKSNGVLITDTTVTFTFDGQTWPTTTGTATITAPTVSTSMAYPITATAEGYIPATGSIMILNVPKLIVAVSGEVKAGQTFTLTIADDTGAPVIGATITFDGKTYTSGAGGVVTITAPSTEGSYPVTATFPGYDTVSSTVTVAKGGGIPGFELLTLIAAIGVAFLLLRRRRN
jgi:hypothetical protein